MTSPSPSEQKTLNYQLHDAAYMADIETVTELLAKRADPNAPLSRHFPRTPLYSCLLRKDAMPNRGTANVIKQLLEAGADPNAIDPEHPLTLLCHALDTGRAFIVPLLLQYKANTNQESPSGILPLQANTSADSIELLCVWKADPFLKNSKGVSSLEHHADRSDLLHHMIWFGYLEPVDSKQKQINVSDLLDEKGAKTPLFSSILKHENKWPEILAFPSRYPHGIADLARIYPHLPPEVQATIDLSAYRRSLAAANQSSAVARYLSAAHPGKERMP